MLVDPLISLLRPIWFRGKLRLLDPRTAKTGQRTAKVFGCKMNLDLSDLIQRRIYLGCYEPAETAFFRKILRPGHKVVDVGANVGYFTALAASLVGPGGAVVGI